MLGSDDLYREWGYTALSRHRKEARFYVNLGDPQLSLPGMEHERDPVQQQIIDVLGRSRAKALAVDVASAGTLERAEPASNESRLEDLLATAPGSARREAAIGRRLEHALAEHEAAERRLQAAQEASVGSSLWPGRRAGAQRRALAAQRALDHWSREAERLTAVYRERSRAMDDWAKGRADELTRFVAGVDSARDVGVTATRSMRLLSRSPTEAVVALAGERPLGLAGRDDWDNHVRELVRTDERTPADSLAGELDPQHSPAPDLDLDG